MLKYAYCVNMLSKRNQVWGFIMTQENLKKLKEWLSCLTEEEKRERDLYLARLARGDLLGPNVGFPSIDKPWLGNYPDQLFQPRKEYTKILDRIKDAWDDEDIMLHYYGTDILAKDFFARVNVFAKALTANGITKGTAFLSSLDSVPEYLELLFATEMIGATMILYQGTTQEIASILHKKKIDWYFAPDFIRSEDVKYLYDNTNLKHIVMVDPLFSVEDQCSVRDNIMDEIRSRYSLARSTDERNINLSTFLEKGYHQETLAMIEDPKAHLFSAFTSGSSGVPKEVKHSSESALGVINQMSLFPSHQAKRDTWLLTILPPTLVATIVAMTCYPLADGKKVILDPYCRLEDVDLEFMHYQANCWPAIPIFFEVLQNSKRIPDDYDMSYVKMFGFGAEPLHQKHLLSIEEFMKKHNCKATLSEGYGQSEGGSDFTIAMGIEMLLSGSSGIPLIDTNIAIFDEKTKEELPYRQMGVIGKSGPGLMLSYDDSKLTSSVLEQREDGARWLYTGDTGYMTEQGMLYVLGRGGIHIFPDQRVFPLEIENKILQVPEVQEAIIVSGKDPRHEDYEVPYLFIVPAKDLDPQIVIAKVNELIEEQLLEEERPEKTFVIRKKPIRKFKTDRTSLQNEYHL